MTKRIEVDGTLHGKPLKLIPDDEKHPLAGEAIFCPQRLGKIKVHGGLSGTFVVEVTELSDGKKEYRVVDLAGPKEPRSGKQPTAGRAAEQRQSTREANSPRPVRSASPSSHDRFIHPYNFVRLPGSEALAEALGHGLFQRGPSPPHDRYDIELNTGFIDCELTTHTDWFIPDARKVHLDPKKQNHKTLGYFTLGNAAVWGDEVPAQDDTTPAIPGSSLRGMIRSIFETATLSCFSVIDDARLEFRSVALLSGRGFDYTPARIIECDAKSARLQLLESKMTDETVPGAHETVYAITRSRGTIVDVHYKGVLDTPEGPQLRSGTRVIAIVKPQSTDKTRYKYREALRVIPIPESFPHDFDIASPPDTPFLNQVVEALDPSSNLVVFGYFFRTGWNIQNKHDERVFFAAKDYNSAGAGLDRKDLVSRLGQFVTDQSVSKTVKEPVVQEANTSLRHYAERHKDELSATPRDARRDKETQLSDYVVKGAKLSKGDLVFALIDPQKEVIGLYPVSLPRRWHEQTIAQLLPEHLRPCSRRLPLDEHKELCPACRVFGWTRDLKDRDIGASSTRVDAVAGHVRFTHGTLLTTWNSDFAQPTTLPILGSPHPSCTEFYLREKQGFSVQGSERQPPALMHINRKTQVPSYPFAMYRETEAELRGRKFSRRQASTNTRSDDPAQGGLIRPPGKEESRGAEGKQNQTLMLLPPEMKFRFRVYFDNLTDDELGALLFALELKPPEPWKADDDRRQFHALGHGTRLGMGRSSVAIRNLHVEQFHPEDEMSRYRQLSELTASNTTCQPNKTAAIRNSFSTAWESLMNSATHGDEFRAIADELVDMMRIVDGPVHYPNRWEGDLSAIEYYDSFSWFVGNRRGDKRHLPGNHRLPSPTQESSGVQRLPTNPTTRK